MLMSDKYFKKYNVASATSKEALSLYFTTEFTDEYTCFVDDIVVEFYNKLKRKKSKTGLPWRCSVKNPPAKARAMGSIPGLGRFHTLCCSLHALGPTSHNY